MSVHTPHPHDSARKHVSGRADYLDDQREPEQCLHACLGACEATHAQITRMDLDAVRAAPGVVCVLTADDIPGANDISPAGHGDDPVFATDEVMYHGQPLFAVIAKTRAEARKAATLARIETTPLPVQLDITDATDEVAEPLTLRRGDAAQALNDAPHVLRGTMRVGGQEHFYLESQIALAIPGEDDEMEIWSSTQHPSEIQHMVAHVLGVSSHAVTAQVRRMGGGFGGKETHGNIFAVVAALGARKTGHAVKLRPDRDQDMAITGKRHDMLADYAVGFDDNGMIQGVDATIAARCGFSADLSGPVTDRALFHADNAYFYPHVHLQSRPMRTNTVSNTAFRGFGGPQGVVVAERMIEEVATHLGMDPLEVRKRNLYGEGARAVTPYHMDLTDNIMPRLISELEERADYAARRAAILKHNKTKPSLRKGIALTPVKFGISFTATFLNQAGALVQIYRDGSVLLNHGGTEMGQGLYVKVAQVVADGFGLPLDAIKVSAARTDKVPNTSATAASAGSDLNGMAALDAITKLKARLAELMAARCGGDADQVRFVDGQVLCGEQSMAFAALVDAAYMERISLSATGFYKTPDIHWDRSTGTGAPFYYFGYGAAVSEVTVDRFTGETKIDRVDILHDVGRSLNPAIDIGQVEGGMVQGMGWLTSEELWWDQAGRLRTHAPSTYKIPLASDVPDIFNVALVDWSENTKPTIHRSKAVGEPPLMLAASVLSALTMAVESEAPGSRPRLDPPATPEAILRAFDELAGVTW